MKTIKYILLLCIPIFFVGCDNSDLTTSHSLSVLIDLTDKNAYVPSADRVLREFDQGQLSDGLELSLSYIGDTPYSQRMRFVLPKGATGLISNEDKRRKTRRLLFARFADSLASYKKIDTSFTRSEIYRSLTRELDYLASLEGTHTLILVSDLKESSPLFSVYNKRSLLELKNNPLSVRKQFLTEPLPKDLSGITLKIMHEPTAKETEVFERIVNLYRDIIEPRGGRVLVSNEATLRL